MEEGLERIRSEFRSRERQTVKVNPETVDADDKDDQDWLTGKPWSIKDRYPDLTSPTEPTSSSVPLTSSMPSTSAVNASYSSREAQ